MKIWKADGCTKCNKSGFSGRIGLFEVLSMTTQLVDIIAKQPSEEEILKEAKRQGMITMRQDGMLKVLNGVTTIEEVIRATKQV
jgi:type IV pilus assembly protein PilB